MPFNLNTLNAFEMTQRDAAWWRRCAAVHARMWSVGRGWWSEAVLLRYMIKLPGELTRSVKQSL